MSRVSPLRLCSTAGLTLGVAAAGLAFAPAALANPVETPLPPIEGPATAKIGEEIILTGEGCEATHADEKSPANIYVQVLTAASVEEDPDAAVPVLDPIVGEVNPDGAWSVGLEFYDDAPLGGYVVWATCEPYTGSKYPLNYPEFEFTLKAAPVTETPAAQTVAPTGKVRGVSANTAGVASPDGGAATGDTASPGKKVVKILTGFKPHEVVTVTLHSAPQTVGTFHADASGTVRVEFTVPAGTPAGAHTLVYEGNMGTYFQETLTVAAAAGSGDNLAYTGASVAMPLGLGAGALALGGGLVFMTRRRNAAAEASQA
jgi:hypothetical protein